GVPDPKATFSVPPGVYEHYQEGIGKRGRQLHEAWLALFERYKQKYPDLAAQVEAIQRRELPAGWDRDLPSFPWGLVDDPKKPGEKKLAAMAGREGAGEGVNGAGPHGPRPPGGGAGPAAPPETPPTLH